MWAIVRFLQRKEDTMGVSLWAEGLLSRLVVSRMPGANKGPTDQSGYSVKIIQQIMLCLLQAQNQNDFKLLRPAKANPRHSSPGHPLHLTAGVPAALESPHVKLTSFLGAAKGNLLLPGPSLPWLSRQ